MRSTVLVGVGRFGASVLDRVESDVDPARVAVIRLPGDDAAEPLGAAIERLFRAGVDRAAAEPRLDVYLVGALLQADLAAVGASAWRALDRYAVLLGGGATVRAVAILPPMVPGDPAQKAIGRLRQLEAVRAGPHAALAGIWLLGTQTTAGLHPIDGVAASAAALLRLAAGAAREVEPLATWLPDGRFTPDSPRLRLASVASLTVPARALARYAEARVAWEGAGWAIARLAAAGGEDVAFDGDPLAVLEDGPAAVAVRQIAAAEGGIATIPATPRVGALADARTLRAAFPDLFRPVDPSRRPGESDRLERDQALAALDRAEIGAMARTSAAIGAHVARVLAPEAGLRGVVDVERALLAFEAALGDEELADPPPPADDGDPWLGRLERAVAAVPSRGIRLGMGVVVAIGVGAAVTLGLSPLAGAVLGLFTGGAWAMWMGHEAREDVAVALAGRSAVLAAVVRRSGAGRRAELELRRRRRRLRRALAREAAAARARLDRVRQAAITLRDDATARLEALGISPEPSAEDDLLEALWRPRGAAPDPLHAPLAPAGLLARRAARRRVQLEPDAWGARLAAALAGDPWVRCADQVAPLAGVERDPDVQAAAADALERFAQRAPAALGAAALPRDAHGDPVLGTGRIAAFAPLSLRDALAGPIARTGLDVTWEPALGPEVVIVRAWDPRCADDFARGLT